MAVFQTTITIGMAVGSLLLLAYWFRYTCLLMLTARTTQDFAVEFAAAHQLSFLEIQALLRDGASVEMDQLRASLERDFEIVSRLAVSNSDAGIEERMLGMSYSVAKFRYRAAARFSPRIARQALQEMSEVVAYFANGLGEQAAGAAAA
jgi:hypothetical protein